MELQRQLVDRLDPAVSLSQARSAIKFSGVGFDSVEVEAELDKGDEPNFVIFAECVLIERAAIHSTETRHDYAFICAWSLQLPPRHTLL
jgi:hypothetical protein